ncbi:MAG: FliO/MopB family protein [Phycisphaerales bacterium]|jgi:flagellar biogenesis protein FliO|nr:FliO/MopB family protein [Phycisphaerales bacterium]
MPHDHRQSRALALSVAVGASGILFLSTVASAFGVPTGVGPSEPEIVAQPPESSPPPTARPEIESRALGAPRVSKDATEAARPATKAEATSPTDMMKSMWRTGGALAAVLGIAVGLAWATKRFARTRGTLAAAIGAGGASPSGVLEVLGRYPLSRGITLVLLKIDARVLLVSQSVSRSGASMQTLCEIDEPDQVASILLKASRNERSSIADRFQSLLSSSDRAMEKELEPAGRQVFRTSSGDTVELASMSTPVPLARKSESGAASRRDIGDDPPARLSQPNERQAPRGPGRGSGNPAPVRGYSVAGASRPLTGAEQLRRRLDAWRDQEERAS